MMNKFLIQKARQANLPHYLLKRGEKLKQSGQRYRHAEHESLVFTNNAYFWNARGEHGNAVDFLMSFYGMDFIEAVAELTGEEFTGQQKKEFDIGDENLCRDMSRAIAYLSKTRGIDYRLIKNLINKKYIYQESDTNNVIFRIYDEQLRPVGSEVNGTLSDKRYKGVQAGSKYGYGFNIPIGEPLKFVLFFESAIDLISFMEIEQAKRKDLNGCLLVSMAGLKESIVRHTLDVFKGHIDALQLVLCVDRDEAGQTFIEHIKTQIKGVREYLVDPAYKDWNEQLQANKCQKP